VVSAVETSRRIYQRMLTYTLNKIIKTIEVAVFLSLGVVLTRTLVVTPLLIVLLLFTNDFVTMSIAADHVSFSRRPGRWSKRWRFSRWFSADKGPSIWCVSAGISGARARAGGCC
jgi:H+-transporting ATPase